jgi:drug/metabolite transporter (DMT)-like permease
LPGAADDRPALAAAAAMVAALLVGAGIVATRFVIDQTHPASLALLRYAIGFCCLLPAALMAGWVRIAPRDVLPIAALGITQFGILIALLNYGLQFIPAARGSLIFATFPFLTMVLAALLRAEPLSAFKTLGVGLTILGVGLALGQKLLVPTEGGTRWIGELAVFGSALSGAVCSVFYRPYLERYSTLPVSAFAMLASVVFLAIPAAAEGFFAALPHFTAGGWAAVGFIGVSSGVGYYLWLWALRHTTPTRVSVFLAVSPIAATALGWLWLGEAISPVFLAGLACVVAGLWAAHR